MEAAGIVCEFDPLHLGHEKLLHWARQESGLPVVCAMSGSFTQRGGPACMDKFARAEMAVRCGADLVVELPTPWAMAPAEQFAAGGVSLLAQCGVTKLYFGSECGDIHALQSVAAALLQPDIHRSIRRELQRGLSYAAARQAALAQASIAGSQLLSQPNNTLAVEYLKAIGRRGLPMSAATMQRADGGHHGAFSASRIRLLLHSGQTGDALRLVPASAADILQREINRGAAPIDPAKLDTALLSRLRLMPERQLLPYDGGGEGLYHRVYRSVQQGRSLAEILSLATTKRYPTARVRRMLWAAFLELEAPERELPYVRVLAATADGRRLLRQMQDGGTPVLTKPADVARLGADAHALFTREARRTDVFALAAPQTPPPCGSDWRQSPVMI